MPYAQMPNRCALPIYIARDWCGLTDIDRGGKWPILHKTSLLELHPKNIIYTYKLIGTRELDIMLSKVCGFGRQKMCADQFN